MKRDDRELPKVLSLPQRTTTTPGLRGFEAGQLAGLTLIRRSDTHGCQRDDLRGCFQPPGKEIARWNASES